jgi:hypothetical protein
MGSLLVYVLAEVSASCSGKKSHAKLILNYPPTICLNLQLFYVLFIKWMISILLRITTAAFLSLVLDYSESRPVSFLRDSCDITVCNLRSLFVVPLTDIITLLACESIHWACGMFRDKN